MKSLVLLRHAKSSRDDPALNDFDRPLNPRGRRAAKAMGAEMRRRKLKFDLILASPATRVAETIELIEAGLGAPLAPRFDRSIYEASKERLLQLVQATGDKVGNLLLAGHNPGLQQLALSLASPEDPAFCAVAGRYPTGALLLLQCPASTWRTIQPGTCGIRLFVKPRDLPDAT